MTEGVRHQLRGTSSPERPVVDAGSRRCRHHHLQPDVECECQKIADYLVELARDGEVQPALQYILDALDENLDAVEQRARRKSESLNDALFARHLRWSARTDTQRRTGVDPYFWG